MQLLHISHNQCFKNYPPFDLVFYSGLWLANTKHFTKGKQMVNKSAKMGTLKQINLYVEPDLHAWLKQIAKRTHRSSAKYLLHLLETDRRASYELYPDLIPKTAEQLTNEAWIAETPEQAAAKRAARIAESTALLKSMFWPADTDPKSAPLPADKK